MSGSKLYPDSNFDSDQNYASFNLHFEKNYLENIPGLTATKLNHVLTYLNNVKTEVDITQIHQISEEIDKNLQVISKMDNGNFYTYIVFGVTIGALVIAILAGSISACIVFSKYKGDTANKITELERLINTYKNC